VFSNVIFENRAVYEIMWKNVVEPGRPQMTIWCMLIAFWIPKATNRHTSCVILITFPLQQWCTIAPQRYVIRTLPILFDVFLTVHHSTDLFQVTNLMHTSFIL